MFFSLLRIYRNRQNCKKTVNWKLLIWKPKIRAAFDTRSRTTCFSPYCVCRNSQNCKNYTLETFNTKVGIMGNVKYRKQKYGKLLILAFLKWLVLGIRLECHWAPQPWLTFSGLARSTWAVTFPLGLSESVSVFPLTTRLTLHLLRRYSCFLLFRGGCHVCFVLL